MKKFILALSVIPLLLTSACTGMNSVGALATQLKDDPAIVQFDLVSVYGTIKFKRIGSNTNSVTLDSDGTMRINPVVNTAGKP